MNSKFNQANVQNLLSYAHLGWPVLPIHSPAAGACSCGQTDCASPGKHPRTVHGLKDATTDEAQIDEWLCKWPDANVAIATGITANLVVLDIDTHNSGEATLTQLEEQYGPLESILRFALLTGHF